MRIRDEGDRAVVQRLARDQWVRLHGTPRVTVITGSAHARALWSEWLALTGATGTAFANHSLGEDIRSALRLAFDQPQLPVAVFTTRAALTSWRAGREDREAAMVSEGWLDIPDPPASGAVHAAAVAAVTASLDGTAPPSGTAAARGPAARLDARSAAETTLFAALEATPSTRGRFALNASLSVHFGARAAEVDLLSRLDRIAIEVDGYHHFTDVECYRRDRRKDLLLQTQGLLVVRLLAEDVMRDPRAAMSSVLQALAHRRMETS